ncbi:MAG: AAA family ATPase, partial [Chloroflexota bacterium]
MAKVRSRFVCNNCGYQSVKSYGRCPNCGEFNTMVEVKETVSKPSKSKNARAAAAISRPGMPRNLPRRLHEVSSEIGNRHQLPVEEFSRVLGGGIVPGSIILLGGAPGIGKSTLLLQMSALLANEIGRVLYVSGEESSQQIKMRAERLGLEAEDLFLLTETNLSDIFEQ